MNKLTADIGSKVPRPGGRTAESTSRALKATLDILRNKGSAGLTMQAVAISSGLHKTTLYRRWGDIGALVKAAVAELEDKQAPIPDTGDLKQDLFALAKNYAQHFKQPQTLAINRLIAGERDCNKQLGQWMDEYWASRQEMYVIILKRAVQRGEITRSDCVEAFEFLIAPLLLRTVFTHQAIDQNFLEQLVESVYQQLLRMN